jgi:hypothetical protein
MALVPAVEYHVYRCTNPPCRKLIKVRPMRRLPYCPNCGDELLVQIFEPTQTDLAAHERAEGMR